MSFEKGDPVVLTSSDHQMQGAPEPEIVVVDAQEILPPAPTSTSTPATDIHNTHSGITSSSTTDAHQESSSNSHQNSSNRRLGFDVLLCGDDTRTSGIRPGTNVTIKLCGSSHIVLPKKNPPNAHYKFIMLNLCGDARLYVPKEVTNVVVRRIALCGNRTIDLQEEIDDEEGYYNDENENPPPNTTMSTNNSTKVTVTIVQLCGNILIANHEELDHDNHQHGNPKEEEIELVQE